MSQTTTPSAVLDTYRALHPKSEALYERARGVIPGGITHDGRNLAPFPVYVDRAKGSHKWDVDGHEYIDYWMGHGVAVPRPLPSRRGRGRPGAGGARHAPRRLPRARGAVGRAGARS